MKLIFALACLLRLSLIPMNVFPQGADAQKKVEELVAALSRKEHKVVERRGVKLEKYLEIRSEPVLKGDVREYSGRYLISDIGYSIEIKVGSDARVEGTGRELSKPGDNKERRFVLKNGKIEGALLTADKVYEGGASERFEGVFIKVTELDSPNAKGVSSFGIGALSKVPVEVNGVSRNRLFYRWQG